MDQTLTGRLDRIQTLIDQLGQMNQAMAETLLQLFGEQNAR